MSEVMPAGADILYRRDTFVEIVPPGAFGHAIGHGALLGVDHELGHGTVHPGLVPTGGMPDVIRARMHHRRQGRCAFIARLRVEGLGTAKRVRGPPGHAVEPRHLADHEIHQADFRRACHRRPRPHRHGRQVVPVNGRAAASDHLGIGKGRQGFGIQLRHGRGDRCGRICAPQNEGAAQHGLIAAAKGAHCAQHGFIPDKRAVSIAVAGGDGVGFKKLLPEEDRAHVHHVLGILRARRHAHEGLVRVFHRGIGDAQVTLADRVIVRFHDVMRAGMQRRAHVAELVEHGEVVERGVAAHVVKVTQVGRARHRHEDRVPPAKPHVMGRVARVVGEVGRDRRDQVPHKPPVKMHPITTHIGPGPFPVRKRDLVAEDDAHVFEDVHRGSVDKVDFLLVHHLAAGKRVDQARQHGAVGGATQAAAGGAATGAGAGL